MIKRSKLLLILLLFISCEKFFIEKDPVNNPESTFEVFWTDQKYSYFALNNINWDSVYNEYKPLVHNEMSDDQLWNIFSNMLCALNDGHVNLLDNIKYTNWKNCNLLSYNNNFDYNLILSNYIKRPFKYSGPLLYEIVDSVGYIYYGSFESEVSESNIDFLINYFKDTKGLMIDIRNNGGGESQNGDMIESRLLDKKTLVEYIYYKNGPGHNDFTPAQELYISPEGNNQYTKPIAILINRNSFSASSFFASRMSVLSHVRLIGDTTGGGAGRPKFFDLPNGWVIRYSSNYALRPDGFNFQNGVPPDFYIEMLDSDQTDGKDTIIEFAKSWIDSQ
jgi:hypothetical protein